MRTTLAVGLLCGSLLCTGWSGARAAPDRTAEPADDAESLPDLPVPAQTSPARPPDGDEPPEAPGLPPAPPRPASPEPPPPAPASPPPRAPVRRRALPRLARSSLSHQMQFGIALLPGSGYRILFPYKENIYCGQLDANFNIRRVCSRRVPIFLDVQPSFGLNARWDLLVDLRFGIERDFTQTRQFAVAPGFRYWVDPELPVKFFATVQVAYDTTAQHNAAITNNDWAFRNSNGVMFEVMRNLAFYTQFGETIGLVRWLRFEVDVGLGVQARFP